MRFGRTPSFGYLLRHLLWIVCLSTSMAHAADKVLDVSRVGDSPVVLTEYFSVLEDHGKQLTLADVRRDEVSDRFTASTSHGQALVFGVTPSAVWLRLSLINTADRPLNRMLEIAHFELAGDVRFFYQKPDKTYARIESGFLKAFDDRPYKHRFYVYPLTMEAHASQVVYVRLESEKTLSVPGRLWTPEAFHAYERKDYAGQSLYFGMVFAMVAFNLLLFAVLGDPNYLIYVAFVTATSLSLASDNGIATEFLWGNWPGWANVAGMVGYCISVTLLLIFMRRLVPVRSLLPRVDHLLKAIMVTLLAEGAGIAISYPTFIVPTQLTLAFSAVVILFTAITCSVKGDRSALFFTTAFAPLCITGVVSVLSHLGVLPSSFFTDAGMQIGSALEMIMLSLLLADKVNQARRDRAQAQSHALNVERQLVETLRSSERVLEERVAQRTTDLETSLQHLRSAQTQLIQSEKMASLGQLVANVAHEINSPIGAVRSSGKHIAEALDEALENLPKLSVVLQPDSRVLFMKLLGESKKPLPLMSTREERALIKSVTAQLEGLGIADPRGKAEVLVQLKAHGCIEDYLPLLQHPDADFMLRTAQGVGSIIDSTTNINMAVDRVSKIVFALRSYSRVDCSGERVPANLEDGMETVLTIYQNQIRQGVELVRDYEKLPPLTCLPDELNQVWTNLIHNALQAMNNEGTLTISIRRVGAEAEVSVSDTGCGIPEAIRDKIFEPFFTTKPVGEGSGLGLDIVKKIIDKHQGRIGVRSTVGVGTTFSVYLPLSPDCGASVGGVVSPDTR